MGLRVRRAFVLPILYITVRRGELLRSCGKMLILKTGTSLTHGEAGWRQLEVDWVPMGESAKYILLEMQHASMRVFPNRDWGEIVTRLLIMARACLGTGVIKKSGSTLSGTSRLPSLYVPVFPSLQSRYYEAQKLKGNGCLSYKFGFLLPELNSAWGGRENKILPITSRIEKPKS